MNEEQRAKVVTPRFVEMVSLKYNQFIQMITQLNSIAEYFLDDDGHGLTFSILDGTDSTFLWKLTIRIVCSKAKAGDTEVKRSRLLRLGEFINIYHHIKQQAEALQMCSSPRGDTQAEIDSKSKQMAAASSCASSSTASAAASSTASSACCSNALDPDEDIKKTKSQTKLYDSIQSMCVSSPLSKDEDICCICMEAKPNMILSCTHAYCENCIKEWSVSLNNTSLSCPVCRCQQGEDDAFLLADKPDYYIMQDEMSKSLFEITDSNKRSSRHSFRSDSD